MTLQDTSNPTPRPRTRRRFKVLLAASLALNLLFVGVIAGAVWRNAGPDGHVRGGAGISSYATPYVRALPKDTRRELFRSLRADHPRSDRKARRESYAQMLGALRAAPFDPQAVETVLTQQREVGVNLVTAGQAKWMQAVTEMSDAERAVYADRLEERLKRGPRRKGKQRKTGE